MFGDVTRCPVINMLYGSLCLSEGFWGYRVLGFLTLVDRRASTKSSSSRFRFLFSFSSFSLARSRRSLKMSCVPEESQMGVQEDTQNAI
jgi:hypothetical protein